MEIIFAALVATFVQFVKAKMPNAYWTLGLVAVLSIVAAGVYTTLVAVGFWSSAVEIMTIAGAIYTFVIARFETSSTQSTNGMQ